MFEGGRLMLLPPSNFLKQGIEEKFKLNDYSMTSYFSRANQRWGGTWINGMIKMTTKQLFMLQENDI